MGCTLRGDIEAKNTSPEVSSIMKSCHSDKFRDREALVVELFNVREGYTTNSPVEKKLVTAHIMPRNLEPLRNLDKRSLGTGT